MPESMEKRILLSFALSFGVLLIFYQFFYSPPTTESPEVPDAAVEEATAASAPLTAGETTGLEPEMPEESLSNSEPATIEAAEVESVNVQTDRYSVRISNEGAVIQGMRLLEYHGVGDEPLELLDSGLAEQVGWPLEFVTGDPEVDEWLKNGLWALEREGNRVRLELAGDGLRAVKELRFDEGAYFFNLRAEVQRAGVSMPFAVVWQGRFGDQSRAYVPRQSNVVYMEAMDFERLNVGSIEDPQPMPVTEFLGLEDQYFLAMIRSQPPVAPSVRGLMVHEGTDDETLVVPRIEVPYLGEQQVYVGPKQEAYLEGMDPVLSSVINYGWFEVIARPLLSVLLWIQGYVGNFGWSIILMTLLINVAVFPLRLKQQLSMLKMQKIQPQMRTLQDKYKKLKPNDPRRQELQSEMMGLYQKHGVNPLGGCLPLLLQMPILYAILQLLRNAIELRQAPWILWIRDLSVYDPYYVLPILMGISMLATQRLTPTAMDPAQARMMMLMPAMFLIFMIRVQSGLVLYWLTSNLVGVGQQVFINRVWVPRQKKQAESLEAGSPPPVNVDTEAELHPPSSEENASPKRRRRKR